VTQNINEIAAGIKLLLMDVDGVMTDGKLYNVPDASGHMVETKAFDTQDGIALQWLSWKGIQTGIISGRVSPATEERCRQCHVSYIYQGHIEKIPILEEILAQSGFTPDQVAYMGDDLLDLPVLLRAGLSAAPADAAPEVRARVHWVSRARGGEGAARELVELVLRAQQKWDAVIDGYAGTSR
jgi:3-deoxy-D-manno-octulosonate 8-phosphate phosphatase (KDO 8-P phosphatase)